MRRLVLALGFVIAAMGLSAQGAMAQSCSFSMSNIAFGAVDMTSGSPVDTTGTLNVTCTGAKNQTVRVCPNIGDGTGGSNSQGSPRVLTDGAGNSILFSLYQDAARTLVWGSWVWPWAGSYPAPQIDMALGTAGSATRSISVYARILGAQTAAAPGNYSSSFAGGHTLMSYAYSSLGACAAIGASNGTQTPFTATATNLRNCTLSASSMNFGTQGVLGANVDATAALRITCSRTVAYQVGLSGGNAAAANPALRKMANGANSITYGLYGDAARTQGWLNTTGYYQGSAIGTGGAQTLTVYGRVPAQTTPVPGTYSDTVVVTLTY